LADAATQVKIRLHSCTCQARAERKKKKNYASSKKLLTSIKEKGPLGMKSPYTRKKRGGGQ